ncbi:hypothetical protein RHGRI_030474 [Rhododendron griersonianum]|uniref:KIB1-4 beta-propeller domain-containing protein n=1 Tax=Rhododendron griersonianum TaxID=479676 RepID=A0AAV6IRC2_9ERIC|nr:hypothetical protein RHGRI_030474 [Rhododendron griersonianum]
MATTGGGWSELPPELLTSIGKRLATRIDVLQFRSTCSSWRSSLPPPPPPPPLPFPIIRHHLPHPPAHYALTQATVYRLEPLHNPSNYPPKSWLIKVSESNVPQEYEVDFQDDICPVFYYGQHYVNMVYKSVLLSLSASNHIMLVVILHGGQLSAMRLGDERWIRFVEGRDKKYSDLINFKGKIYALSLEGDFLVIDSSLNITEYSTPLDPPARNRKYLVESCGELWLLNSRWIVPPTNDDRFHLMTETWEIAKFAWNEIAIWFLVFKLNEEEHKWVEVPDHGDRILFAGRDCSFTVSASDFEGNCKGNCIFFLNDACSTFDENYHDDYDALRGSGGKEPEIHLVGDRSVDRLVAYPGYANLFWPLPSWLALGPERRSASHNACSSSSQP